MPNTVFDNYFLANEISDQYDSMLDLNPFCIQNNDLAGVDGMKWKVNVYAGSGTAEKLTQGVGNSNDLSVAYIQKEYNIALAQSRFPYYDEEMMKDSFAINAGARYQATDLFNVVNADIYAAFNDAALCVGGSAGFDVFADAQALLNAEAIEAGQGTFAFISPKDLAAVRKAVGSSLQYVEAFARQGYVGSLAGTNLYVKKNATEGVIVMAAPTAVTVFNKPGIEAESERDANTRKNTLYARKYYLAALTDATKAVKIGLGTYEKVTATGDGSTKTVTLSHAAKNVLVATVDAVVTTDFTVSSTTLTFGTAPANGDAIVVEYVY